MHVAAWRFWLFVEYSAKVINVTLNEGLSAYWLALTCCSHATGIVVKMEMSTTTITIFQMNLT